MRESPIESRIPYYLLRGFSHSTLDRIHPKIPGHATLSAARVHSSSFRISSTAPSILSGVS